MSIETAFSRNREFAVAGGHRDAVIFPNLRLFVITCLDPRRRCAGKRRVPPELRRPD
jgi:hypothetical protein